ncbi:hypothetical protein IGI39_004922 [Enterococcus sp. AZ135]|uniref:hypothetical protein n=1 Tax=unclassified Enterococcus TaxID=2608891 RepID=UPI003F29B9D1
MTDSVNKMTIRNLADELGVTKNTVRNYLIKAGYDLAQYKENEIIMLDKELIGVARSIYQSMSGQFTGKMPVNNLFDVSSSEREILFLKEQLKEKDNHISELTQMVRDQQKLTLLQQEKNDQLLVENTNLKNRKWWRFWKNKA